MQKPRLHLDSSHSITSPTNTANVLTEKQWNVNRDITGKQSPTAKPQPSVLTHQSYCKKSIQQKIPQLYWAQYLWCVSLCVSAFSPVHYRTFFSPLKGQSNSTLLSVWRHLSWALRLLIIHTVMFNLLIDFGQRSCQFMKSLDCKYLVKCKETYKVISQTLQLKVYQLKSLKSFKWIDKDNPSQ